MKIFLLAISLSGAIDATYSFTDKDNEREVVARAEPDANPNGHSRVLCAC